VHEPERQDMRNFEQIALAKVKHEVTSMEQGKPAYAYRNFPSMTVNPIGVSRQLADGHDLGWIWLTNECQQGTTDNAIYAEGQKALINEKCIVTEIGSVRLARLRLNLKCSDPSDWRPG
jgi:hypothetical protein